ncbi:phage tail tube protein [Microvirga terricola]|uniref:Phage tail tube protein n=1 Tax=Microvirga terricola TaxID=2719797 RepID=A0ABX0V845_9HYPH|nr:hypothetical protein [Microvirga terricola]
MTQVVGIIDIVWKGTNIPVEKGAKAKFGGLTNNPVVVGRSVMRAQEFKAGEVSAKTALRRGQSAKELFKNEEGELQVQFDTGQTYIWPDAFLSGDIPDITGGEGGQIELKWSVGEPEEIIG